MTEVTVKKDKFAIEVQLGQALVVEFARRSSRRRSVGGAGVVINHNFGTSPAPIA